MAKSPEEQIAMMVDGAQPHCDEPLTAAMICSHAGSMMGAISSALSPAGGFVRKTSKLPNPVLIAVGPTTVYAFKYKPKGFKVKLKQGSEVARWPRDQMEVQRVKDGKISEFVIITADGGYFHLEVTTVMGAQGSYELFMNALGATPAPS